MDNPMSLEGRVIVITGAAQGIGRGVATKAASLGATLALIDINGDGARDTAKLLGGDIDVYAGSVADAGFIQDTVESVVAKHGIIHGLFNNAGIIRTAMIHKMSLAD
jgi:3-oxoacyl-[acyl-carrier protein] reductase